MFPANRQDWTTAECVATWGISCYDADQIEQAYNLNGLYSKGVTGKGQTIVIIDVYGSPTIGNDLVQFDADAGLPNPSLSVIQPVGKVPAYDFSDSDMLDWAGETTLDVEYAHAIAPGAKIVLVEAPTDSSQSLADAAQYAISHRLGSVISQSYVVSESAMGSSLEQTYDSIYRQAAAEHITVLAASGDTGAATYANSSNGTWTYYDHPAVNWPADDPYVTAVGGTSLNLNQNGNRVSPDVVWNDSYIGAVNIFLNGNADSSATADATGGGKSVVFARPSYQNSVKNVVGDSRGIPDISMSGACDGTAEVFQSYLGGDYYNWQPVCGTSEASPLFAGIVALADQVAGHSLGFINPAIYKLSAEHAKGIVLVTSGNNSVPIGGGQTVQGYSARNGYSLAAGVGTINGLYFVPELASLG
jgi:subtilase family serine protease